VLSGRAGWLRFRKSHCFVSLSLGLQDRSSGLFCRIPAVVQLSVDPALIGVATALTITARSVGGAVGTSVVGAVFTSKLTAVLGPYIANAAINAGLPSTSITAFVTAMATGKSLLCQYGSFGLTFFYKATRLELRQFQA
jgi:hypothetical protein